MLTIAGWVNVTKPQALPHTLFVGEAKEWIPDIIGMAQELVVNEGMQPGADIGPMISPEALTRAEDLIQSGARDTVTVHHTKTSQRCSHSTTCAHHDLASACLRERSES